MVIGMWWSVIDRVYAFSIELDIGSAYCVRIKLFLLSFLVWIFCAQLVRMVRSSRRGERERVYNDGVNKKSNTETNQRTKVIASSALSTHRWMKWTSFAVHSAWTWRYYHAVASESDGQQFGSHGNPNLLGLTTLAFVRCWIASADRSNAVEFAGTIHGIYIDPNKSWDKRKWL